MKFSREAMMTAQDMVKGLLDHCEQEKLPIESDGTEPTNWFKRQVRKRGLVIKYENNLY